MASLMTPRQQIIWSAMMVQLVDTKENHNYSGNSDLSVKDLIVLFFSYVFSLCAHQQVASSVETVKRTSTCGNRKRAGPLGKLTNGHSVPTASQWRTCSGRPPRPQYVSLCSSGAAEGFRS